NRSSYLRSDNKKPAPDGDKKVENDVVKPAAQAPAVDDSGPVTVFPIDSKSIAQPLTIQEARILTAQRQEVPSKRDGELLFLATPAVPGGIVPRAKRLEYEVPTLAVRVNSQAVYDRLKEEEKLVDVDEPTRLYRRVRPSDGLEPGSTAIIRQKLVFRKLEVGD